MVTSGEPFDADHPLAIARTLFVHKRRALVYGESGMGKSTLVKGLAGCLDSDGIDHRLLVADPGSPSFGIPGAVCLGQFENGAFRRLDYAALCSLNAGRFRLPLVEAVHRLTNDLDHRLLLIDGPGLTRGIAAAELLTGLIHAARVDTLLLLVRRGRPLPLAAEWKASGIQLVPVRAAADARAPSARQRTRARTALWDAHLSAHALRRISLDGRSLIGTPPSADNARLWRGRQVALVGEQRTIAMGEVVDAGTGHLTARLPATQDQAGSLLVRDAGRNSNGELVTVTPPPRAAFKPSRWPVSPTTGPSMIGGGLTIHLGALSTSLVNGIFGDPLIHLRLPQQKRSLLFDLGEGNRLPARIAHQVSDVFITHAHIDHISGFFWLLRARIGEFPPCRLYGTAHLSRHIRGMIDGVHWDRIGDRGPRFEVLELEGRRIRRRGLHVGESHGAWQHPSTPFDGCLVDDPLFTIRAAVLDHGIPVLALAYEETPRSRVIPEALGKAGFAPGPWLGELKRRIAAGEGDTAIRLPDGSTQPATRLAGDLIRMVPGRKLVYATDVADSPANRQKLIDLARGADLFICEAAYTQAHRHLAMANGHLTARACGQIAAAAGVRRLVPFHLSRRYEQHPEPLFSEIKAACPNVKVVSP